MAEFRTIAGTVGVITAVVAGSAVGLAVAVVSSNSLPAALAGGGCVGLGIWVALDALPGFGLQCSDGSPTLFEDQR